MTFPKDEKLAACVRDLLKIPYEHAKQMTAAQILSLAEWHHAVIPKAQGGLDVHWNCECRPIAEHAEITRKVTVPQIAKDRRQEKKWGDFMRAIQAGRKPPKREPRWGRRKVRR